MTFRALLAVGCAFLTVPAGAAAPATTDFDQAVTQLGADSRLLSGWMTDQLRYIVPFNATAGNVVPKQIKLFGVELGVEGVVTGTRLDVSALRALPSTIVNTNEIDTFDRMPFPAVLGHAKVGLPFGFDAGLRLGGIPSKSYDKDDTKVSVKNSIVGIDLRKKIIDEGIAKPFGLTMGLNYTHATGNIEETTPFTSNAGGTVESGGQTFSTTLDAIGTNHSDWNTNSVGVQAILNKQIAFLNPYVGASANRNWGTVSNRLTTAGTVTLTDVNNAANSSSQAFSAIGDADRSPNGWDIRALAGIEFSILPFVKLGIQGEYAGARNLGAALGLRAQFP